AADRVPFSVGVLFAGLAATLFAYLMLAHPAGRLHSRTDRRFLAWTGGALAVLWFLAVVTTRQPPLQTPLLHCARHCPDNVFSLGFAANAPALVKAPLIIAWVAIAWGTPLLLTHRVRAASAPLRRSLIPVWMT